MPVFTYGTGTALLCRATRLLGRIYGTVDLNASVSLLVAGKLPLITRRRLSSFAAISRRQGIAARALEVTLLTGLRTGEVIGARWPEIDLQRKTWVIPPERLKDRKTRTEPHRVPLSPQVVAILKTLPKLGEFVFPGVKPGKPLSNMAMLGVLKDMNCDEYGEPRWTDPKSGRPITPHGLRATFRTWGEDTGFPRDLLEESLGHQIGTAVERAYRRTDSFDRRRAIMQAWADFCCGKPIGRRCPLGVKAPTGPSNSMTGLNFSRQLGTLAADCGSGGRWLESTQYHTKSMRYRC